MTRSQFWAYRIRWWLLVAGMLLTLLGIWGLFGCWPLEIGEVTAGTAGTPLMLPVEWSGPFEAPGFYINSAVTLGLVLLMQWAFLLPRRGWLPRLSKTGRPMKLSIIVASCMAMLLTVGLVITLMEINDAWEFFLDEGLTPVWIVMGVVWLIWAVIFFMTYRDTQDRYTWMTRMVHRLIAGSFLEVLVATGVFAWNPQKNNDCYCARGSYTGLVLGGTVLIWAFGPGLILLFMRERHRRLRGSGDECVQCGYDLRGSIAAGQTSCPECGAMIVLDAAEQSSA